MTQSNYDLLGRVLSVVMCYALADAITESQTYTTNGRGPTRSDGNGNLSTYATTAMTGAGEVYLAHRAGAGFDQAVAIKLRQKRTSAYRQEPDAAPDVICRRHCRR